MPKLAFFSKRRAFIAIPLILVLIGGVWIVRANAADKPTTKIQELTAIKGDLDVYIEADAIVSADKTSITFSQAGIVKQINVRIGDTVAVGDILAVQDSSKYQSQVDQARANLGSNVSKASRLQPGSGEELVVKQVAVNAARTALTAEQALYNDVVAKNGMGSSQELAEAIKLRKAESDLSTAESQYSLTKATYKDAQYAVSSSSAALQVAQISYNETILKAPVAGVVSSVNGTLGQQLGGSSQQTTAALITIANPSDLTLISSLDEEEIAKIKVGQPIKAEFSAQGATVSGSVSYVAPVAKVDQNGLVSYEVRMSFDKGSTTILDGMSASIKFITKSAKDVVKVQNKAITINQGKSYVSYYDSSNKIVTKEVTTGFTDGKSVEITSGMYAGDKYLVIETK